MTIGITLKNTAPSSPASILLGEPGWGVPIGTYWAMTNTYLPEGAEEIRARVVGQPSINLTEREFGHPVVLQLLRTPPGGSVTGTISYRLPHALTDVGDGQGYAVDLLPMPALRPAAYSVEIAAAPGSSIDEAAPGIEVSGGKARYRAIPEVRTALWVHLTPP